MKLRINKELFNKLHLVKNVWFDVWPKGIDVCFDFRKGISLTDVESKDLENAFQVFFSENNNDGPCRFVIGGMLSVELCGDEPICHWIGNGRYRKKVRIYFSVTED